MAQQVLTNTWALVDTATDNMQLLLGAGLSGVNIDGGNIDATIIGAVTPAAISGTDVIATGQYFTNSSNNAAESGVLVDNTGGGDPVIRFRVGGASKGVIGIDNSDGDKLKLSPGSALDAPALTLESSLDAIFSGDVTLSTGLLDITVAGTTDFGLTIQRSGVSGRAQMRLQDELNADIWRVGMTAGGGENYLIFDDVADANALEFTSNTLAAIFGGDVTVPGNLSVTTGFLNIGAATEVTISAGVITATKSDHLVDTEADAASDDLVTINGGVIGNILFVQAADSGRTVVCKDGTGNMLLAGDFSLDSGQDVLMLKFEGSVWIEQSRSNNA